MNTTVDTCCMQGQWRDRHNEPANFAHSPRSMVVKIGEGRFLEAQPRGVASEHPSAGLESSPLDSRAVRKPAGPSFTVDSYAGALIAFRVIG